MRVFLCVCFIATFVCRADGQVDTNICDKKGDFEPCSGDWNCNLYVSKCFCKSEKPYCRCNNYIDEFYLGTSCSQKWTTLSFALVATLPGVALAVVVGLAVHLAHTFGKSSKSNGAGNALTHIPEEDLFPGVVFASDLKSPPSAQPLPPSKPTPVQVPMVSSWPYSAPDNTRPAFDRPPRGAPYSLPPSPQTLGVPDRPGQQPYSYTGGGAQVLSNPYARARNPYEEHNVSAEPYNQPVSPRAYEEQRMSPPPPPSYNAPENRSVFPRAQIGRMY
ncbi:hypothetical protein PHYPO_G00249840 [Pangasianodon hypophthalmus]|uniref:EGF-like domain-containing protein n=1 Tax=Pangasianodon hypophthalmus TaxID=310915 RepID=A0A5N5JC95_PANHP|nr:uncharacterized protein zgc:158432 [Pangasianodon hypophthalmus]KAB5515394.1 hypothetical protein PHYPO_G00249840 [Pangasianodon hypophthalmus]